MDAKQSTKGRRINMSRILLLEDDLSLINGLSFAFKKQGKDKPERGADFGVR